MPPILVPSSAKHILTQMLVTKKLNGRKYIFFWEALDVKSSVPARTACSKLATQEQE